MIVKTSMLVVAEDHNRAGPSLRICGDCHINLPEEIFSMSHCQWGVIIICLLRSEMRRRLIAWFYNDYFRVIG